MFCGLRALTAASVPSDARYNVISPSVEMFLFRTRGSFRRKEEAAGGRQVCCQCMPGSRTRSPVQTEDAGFILRNPDRSRAGADKGYDHAPDIACGAGGSPRASGTFQPPFRIGSRTPDGDAAAAEAIVLRAWKRPQLKMQRAPACRIPANGRRWRRSCPQWWWFGLSAGSQGPDRWVRSESVNLQAVQLHRNRSDRELFRGQWRAAQ